MDTTALSAAATLRNVRPNSPATASSTNANPICATTRAALSRERAGRIARMPPSSPRRLSRHAGTSPAASAVHSVVPSAKNTTRASIAN